MEKYLDLTIEIGKLWDVIRRISVIPAVSGAIGTVLEQLKNRITKMVIPNKIMEILWSILLRTARILWKVLEI